MSNQKKEGTLFAMENVVVSQIVGGLGNQMFQYAAAKAVANRTNATLLLDLTGFQNDKLRIYELDQLKVTTPPAHISLIKMLKGGRITKRLKRFLPMFFAGRHYTEPYFHFDEKFNKVKSPIYLSGYFQSEKYFPGLAEELRKEFQPRTALEGKNLEIATAIKAAKGKAASLHVRRGDYANDEQTMKAHGLTPLEYYRKALQQLRQDVGACQIFVFSDDPEWTKANLRGDEPMTFVTHNVGKGVEDLRLMTLCDHHIIANSSFSWWGAWLNPKTSKRVYAPKRWFQGLPHDTKDLIPSGWVII